MSVSVGWDSNAHGNTMHGYGETVQGGKEEEEREEFTAEVAEGPQRKRRILGDEEREGG
jgi:hypothetical protein